MHVFTMLSAIGALLILMGMAFLVWLIPLSAGRLQKSEARTEFYSARAAYCCVIAGLGIFAVLAVGAVLFMILLYHR